MHEVVSSSRCCCYSKQDCAKEQLDGSFRLIPDTCNCQLVTLRVTRHASDALLIVEKSPHFEGRSVFLVDGIIKHLSEDEFRSVYESNRVRFSSSTDDL